MRLELRDEKRSEEKVIKLFLRRYGDGSIRLHAECEEGKDWDIIDIKKNGRFERCTGIPSSIGLCLDSEGRIQEESDE